jgi:hypothetical protein
MEYTVLNVTEVLQRVGITAVLRCVGCRLTAIDMGALLLM